MPAPTKASGATPCYVVRDLETREEVHRVQVASTSPWTQDRILRGMLINMNTDRFFVDTSEVDDAGGAP